MYDLLLKNVKLIDPSININAKKDIAIKDGKISKIENEISESNAKECFDLKNFIAIPGIIDLHMHASAWLGGKFAHRMLALAGVTTALDMAGPIETVLEIGKNYGTGLNIASIEYVRPGYTVSSESPTELEIEKLIDDSLSKGSIGIKLLGGHYPLKSEATKNAIKIANEKRAYVAFHAGTLSNGSNIDGALEAVELADGKSLHLAHINSYCRGNVRDSLKETQEIIEALKENPNIRSESYLSPFNGTSAKISNNIPESSVTIKCLKTGGFTPDYKGMEEAILSGWARINVETGGSVKLMTGKSAVDYWKEKNTDTTVSFSVNPAVPRYRLAVEKKNEKEFVVDAISTDGGGIPRNVIVEMGLSLVKLNALTLEDFVVKTSINPAKILGLNSKGSLKIGNDADITIIDFEKQKPYMSFSNGKLVMYNGYVLGKGLNIITTEKGKDNVKKYGLNPIITDISKSAFYNGL